MPQYPSAVKSFTTRNAGDVIQPAHINDLQDEVNAIEAGLLNGTAPLNSSKSTLAALSVTGNSTFAGNVTIAGTLTVTGSSPLVPASCRLTHSVNQNVASGALTGLNWDTDTYNPNSLHSTGTNSSRITFASSGLYAVGASVQWASLSSGASTATYIMRILLNDAVGQAVSIIPSGFVGGLNGGQSLAGTVYATSTADYVTIQVQQISGSTNSVLGTGTAASTVYGTWFWAYKVG